MAEPSYEELRVRLKETEQKLESRELKLRELGVDDWEPKPVAPEAPVVIKTCNHIRENGAFCQSVALRGREYCRFHLRERGRRLKMARARARGERWHLDLPPLEDLYAVQVSIMRVLQALDHDRLDKGRGSLMLYGLQQAATNLRCPQEVWERSSRFELADDEGVEEYDDFEAEFDLPQGIDLKTPPEVVFPEATPVAISEERADLMEVTPLDIELMEIRQREGPEAVTRKLKQLDAAEDRRYRRAQAQLAHARHVVRAAQNLAREAHLVERSQADRAAADQGAGRWCPALVRFCCGQGGNGTGCVPHSFARSRRKGGRGIHHQEGPTVRRACDRGGRTGVRARLEALHCCCSREGWVEHAFQACTRVGNWEFSL